MYYYLYACLAALVCLGVSAVALMRKDLRGAIVASGVVGGVIEVGSEFWYLQDYWQPLTIFSWPALEDFWYGFGTTALSVCAVPFWSFVTRRTLRYTPERVDAHRWYVLLAALAAFAAVMTVGQQLTPIPSIWIATLCFLVGGLIACALQRGMWVYALVAGCIMGLLAAIGYGVGLNLLIDGKAFLQQVYLLTGTRWDIRVLGQVPLDEIAWNLARGWCMAAMYTFISGRRLMQKS